MILDVLLLESVAVYVISYVPAAFILTVPLTVAVKVSEELSVIVIPPSVHV